jgi:quinol monooxygenase YgiN
VAATQIKPGGASVNYPIFKELIMATIISRIRCKPGMAARFEELAAVMIRNTKQTEPDCTRYEYWRSADPHTYFVLECFKDVNGFYAHQANPCHTALVPELLACFEEHMAQWLDPVGSVHSNFPATADKALPGDCSAAMVEAKRQFPTPTVAWWAEFRRV